MKITPELIQNLIGKIKEIDERLDCLEYEFYEEKEHKPRRFHQPELHEVNDYFVAKGGDMEMAVDFYNFYDSNGWMVGKNKMKKWEAAASRWIKSNGGGRINKMEAL